MRNYKELLANINTFIFDYDGVLTDGKVILQENGEPLRSANVRDGYALQLAVKKGYNIAIISGGRSNSIVTRLQALKIKDIFLGIDNKLEVFHNYMSANNIRPENVLYMGDDIPDYHAMKEAGVPTCPANAAEEIKQISLYISHVPGGEGCARDVIEQVLKIQGHWMSDDGYAW
jgi:3-deoxy-D-manno-octulosonate 8-phosphate phosphatase (KDO 8-P phosphatase)